MSDDSLIQKLVKALVEIAKDKREVQFYESNCGVETYVPSWTAKLAQKALADVREHQAPPAIVREHEAAGVPYTQDGGGE